MKNIKNYFDTHPELKENSVNLDNVVIGLEMIEKYTRFVQNFNMKEVVFTGKTTLIRPASSSLYDACGLTQVKKKYFSYIQTLRFFNLPRKHAKLLVLLLSD